MSLWEGEALDQMGVDFRREYFKRSKQTERGQSRGPGSGDHDRWCTMFDGEQGIIALVDAQADV